jgi:hypothetical protein
MGDKMYLGLRDCGEHNVECIIMYNIHVQPNLLIPLRDRRALAFMDL